MATAKTSLRFAISGSDSSVRYASSVMRRGYDFLKRPSFQRFFISSERRFLPAGVRPRRIGLPAAVFDDTMLLLVEMLVLELPPSSAAMALSSRSRSCFSSLTILTSSILSPPSLLVSLHLD
jgi:hypothetical protein